MKFLLRSFTVAAFVATTAFPARADTAGLYDLIVGFKQNGATNDVMIDLGNINNYMTAGTYVIGNYDAILSDTFGGSSWKTSSTLNWGAAASFKDTIAFELPTQNWVTSKWTFASGVLGVANSVAWTQKSEAAQSSANLQINRAYTGMNYGSPGYTVGVAEAIATANASSWKSATTTGASAFNVYTASQFNNNLGNIANGSYSASDLYQVGNSSAGTTTQFIGTFALFQNGDLTFTVAAIPEPSTSAALLGAATLGFVALRRRKQALVAWSNRPLVSPVSD